LQSAYCGAKHAIAGFTDSLRSELIHDGKNIHLTMVQLPAMNTPQFNWCRSKLPRHPQPVPPIYQPEVAADVIVWASHRQRREIFVGAPTVMAIEGNKIAPGFADKYLGRNGFDSQQTSEPVAPDRADNLFEPVAADFGAHGMFDREARGPDAEVWLTKHKRSAAIAGAAALGALTLALSRKRA
jgi:hypothetical protein